MTRTNKTFALAATLAVVALTSGCAATPVPGVRSAGDLVLAVPVDQADGEVEVVVTGADIRRPARARLQVEDGVARGTVYDVEAGQNRRVLLSARTDDGRRCALELNTVVAGAKVTEVESDGLQCEARHQAPATAVATDRGFTYASSDVFPPIL